MHYSVEFRYEKYSAFKGKTHISGSLTSLEELVNVSEHFIFLHFKEPTKELALLKSVQ